MLSVNNFHLWNKFMSKKKVKDASLCSDNLPKVTLMKSENPNIDRQKKADEIRYYLTQIILLADKVGRPTKKEFSEVPSVA